MTTRKTITIAADSAHPLTVKRLGYGTMRLTGPGIYGEPKDRPGAIHILQEAVANGVEFLDTADYYGEDVTNRLIYEALFPYPDRLVICTKLGATRKPDKSWIPYNTPANLRSAVENNLRTLKLEQIALVHFRIMPGHTDFEKGLEAMFTMQNEGKILHVGVSNVSPAELEKAIAMGPIASVENMYGHVQRTALISPHGDNRGGEEVLHICEQNQVALIPYFSLMHSLHKKDERMEALAKKYNVTPAQVNIAWLLHRSPWILPIPGTTSSAHLKENIAAADLELTAADMAFLH